MNRLAAVVVALALWCGSALAYHEVSGWEFTNPGGGGTFTCSDVDYSGSNYSLMGTDVGGLFWRSGLSGSWTPVGYFDGIYSTHIRGVKFCPHGEALVATENGCYYSSSSSHGAAWSTSQIDTSDGVHLVTTLGMDITAVGINKGNTNDVQTFAISYQACGKATFAISTDGGATFYHMTDEINYKTDKFDRWPIKIGLEPNAASNNRRITALMGRAQHNQDAPREMWRWDPTNHWVWVTDPDKTAFGSSSPIDFAYRSNGSAPMIVSFEADTVTVNVSGTPTVVSVGSAGSTSLGKVYVYDRMGDSDTGLWYRQRGALLNGGADDPLYVTGSVWSNGANYFVIGKTDACGSSKGGIFEKSDLDGDSTKWYRRRDGSAWGKGWADCANARGETFNNMANTVNRFLYWCSGSFAQQLGSDTNFVALSTSGDGAPWSSNRLDNVECIALQRGPADSLLAGYYDIGLWERTSGGWSDLNPRSSTAWCGSDHLGGNVNGIAVVGTTVYVTESSSSKNEDTKPWQVWKLAGSPPTWTQMSDTGDFPNGTFLTGLMADDSGTLYVSYSNGSTQGVLKKSTDNGASWTNDGPSAVVYCARNAGLTYIAGGPDGIFRRYNGGSWSQPLDLNMGSCHTSGQTTANLHKLEFSGVHDIRYGADGVWYATVFRAPGDDSNCGGSSYKGGLYYSTDDGQHWSQPSSSGTDLASEYYAQQCFPDSIGRVHVTFSSDASGPVNDKTEMDNVQGVITLVSSAGSSWKRSDDVYQDTYYRNRTAVPIYTATVAEDSPDQIFVGASGYGVLYGSIPCSFVNACPDPPCGTERPRAHAQRPHEEVEPARIGRREYPVAEARALVQAGQLELYDVSGRRTREPRAGLFFSIERNKAGAVTARHLVLVRR